MGNECPKCHTDNPSDAKLCKECSMLLPFPGDLSVTKTLEKPEERLIPGAVFAGRYRIVGELGRGGMGRVYRADDTQINESVAIKLIRSGIAGDEKVLERFANELRLARKISHKNVCRMYHLEKEGETPYISMEYLEGEDLKYLIREKNKLSAEEAVSAAIQVCEGLAEAHRLGVVHRDLKPQNIMVDKDGQVKIMDFGIARSTDVPGVTQTGVIIGTPDYMSPEQADGLKADHRSDIYSLGVILYEMVTGELPFRGETAISVALKHRTQLPLDPGKINPLLSADMRRLILVCLEKDPGRRYQTASDLLFDLGNVRDGLPLGTKIQPQRETSLSKIVRRKWFFPAAVILTAAIVGIILWRFLPPRSPALLVSGKPSIAVLDFQNRTGDVNLDINTENLSLWLISDLAQSMYLTIIPDDKIYEILSELKLLDTERYTTQNLKDIAMKAEVSHILRGILTRTGDTLLITANLQEASGMNLVGSIPVEGEGEPDFHSMVDELTLKIKANLDLSETQIAEDVDEEVGKITTESSQALALYKEGVKNQFLDPQKSVELLKKAVEIDPEFAMAYRSLAIVYSDQIGDREKSRNYSEKAEEFIDRVTLRERLHILAIREKDLRKRSELGKELLTYYPDDAKMHNNLHAWYLWTEDFEQDVEHLEAFVQKRPKSGLPYSQLMETYLALGQYDKVKNVAEISRKEIKNEDVFYWPLAYAYAATGKRDLAFLELSKIKKPMKRLFNLILIGDLYVVLDDEAEAEKFYRQIFDSERKSDYFDGWVLLANLSCFQGKFKQANEQLKEGLKLAVEMQDNYHIVALQGLLARLAWRRGNIEMALELIENETSPVRRVEIFAAGNHFGKAQEEVEKLRIAMEDGQTRNQKRATREHSYAEGLIALAKGNYAEAVSYLRNAQDLLVFPFPTDQAGSSYMYAFYFEPLALAYYKSGDLESAQEEFEKISKMTLGRESGLNIYAKSFYMLGKISEQRGWSGKAIENYEKFLDLWKDADPGLPEVDDARKRLVWLKEE